MNDFDETPDPAIDALLREVFGVDHPPDVLERVNARLKLKSFEPLSLEASGSTISPEASGSVVTPPPLPVWAAEEFLNLKTGGAASPSANGKIVISTEKKNGFSRNGTSAHGVHAEANDNKDSIARSVERSRTASNEKTRRQFRTRLFTMGAFLALSACLLVGITLGTRSQNHPLAVDKSKEHGSQVVKTDPSERQAAVGPRRKEPASSNSRRVAPSPKDEELATDDASERPARLEHGIATPSANSAVQVRSNDAEIIAFTNSELRHAWTGAGLTPSVEASDSEWCRRAFLRLIGRIPTAEEVNYFVTATATDKHEKLVDALMESSAYQNEFVGHWRSYWTNALLGGARNERVHREGFAEFLDEAIRERMPYDELATRLLTAVGSAKPGSPDFDGAVNYQLSLVGDRGTVMATKVSRNLLGIQLGCAQCHDHPSQPWTQKQFWSMAACFRQIKVETKDELFRLKVVDFAGEEDADKVPGVDHDGLASNPNHSAEALVFYEDRAGIVRAVTPQFLDEPLPESGASKNDRRAELAKRLVRHPLFARAFVNRMWSYFHGFGFTRPFDDLGDGNEPTHPEILDRLASEFVESKFDMRRVIRWMALADSFRRSSQILAGNESDLPELGSRPLFSRYYTRQLSADAVYDSLATAAKLRKELVAEKKLEEQKRNWLGQLARSTSSEESHDNPDPDGSLRQLFALMTSEPMKHATEAKSGTLFEIVSKTNLTFEEQVDHLFLSALSRKPNGGEVESAKKLLEIHKGRRTGALQDIWWALLNSNEFVLDH